MGRPRKNPEQRVHDQLHVGLRVPPPLANVLPQLVAAANGDLRRRGLPPKISLSNLVTHWISERAAIEEPRTLGTSTVQEWLAGPTPPEPPKEGLGRWGHFANLRAEATAKTAMAQQVPTTVKIKQGA
jgi:hypothetical protein